MSNSEQLIEPGKRQEPLASQLAELVNVTQDGILVVDDDGKVVFGNAAAAALLGRQPDEIVGYQLGQPAVGAGPTTVAIRRKGGAPPLTVQMRTAATSWQGNSAYVVNLNDITEAQRAFAQAQRLAAIVQSTEDAIIGKSLDGTIATWNPGAERMYGYTAEEAIGRSVGMLFPPDNGDEHTKILRRVAQGETVTDQECVRCAKDGPLLYVSITTSPIRDEEGAIVGASTIARDVSDQRREREALARRTYDLGERVKEQACMYACSSGANQARTIDELVDSVAHILPTGFQSPHLVSARVTLNHHVGTSRAFAESKWRLSAEVMVHDETRGRVEVFAPETMPGENGNRFLPEEENLVKAIAHLAANACLRLEARQRIHQLNQILRAIQGVNKLIVKEKDRGLLIQGACETLSQSSTFYGCWLAVQADAGIIDVAHAGLSAERVARLTSSIENGILPTCQNSDAGVLCRFPANESVGCEGCSMRGIGGEDAVVVAALTHAGHRYGTIAVYVQEQLQEDGEEIALLQEVADDLALALHAIAMEEARQKREYLLQETARVAHVGGWEWNPATGNITFTDEWQHIHGHDAREGSLADWLDCVHPDDRDALSAAVVRAMSDSTPIDERYRIVRPDTGAIRHVHAHGNFRTTTTGPRMIGATVDVTENHERVARLEAQAHMLASIGEAVIVIDPQGLITYWNAAAERLYGWTAEEALGKPVCELTPSPESKLHAEAIMTCLARGESWSGEFSLQRKDGSSFDAMVLDTPIISSDGKVEAIIGVSSDITARKQAEREMSDLAMKLTTAINAGRVGLWDWDLSTNQVTYSTEWKRQIGYADNEIADDFEEWRSRVHPDDLRPTLDRIQAFLTKPCIGLTTEFRLRHKDSSYRWILAQSTGEIQGDGKLQGVVGSHIDVTDLHRAEEERLALAAQLQQAQKMDSIGRLAGGVAHDFNNKLSIILGFAEIAMMKMPSSDPSYRRLQEIRRAGESAADLTRQLLAFARKQTIAPRVLDPNDLIAGMLKMLGRLIGEDIELLWKPAHRVRAVKIDPGQVDQILANLVVNARDAIHDVGTITIETANVTLDAAICALHPESEPGDYVMIAVSDTGIGMGEATLCQIFEPFFTTKPLGKGTGLGLSTVYGVVRQNHGAIDVVSHVGAGTTFKIYLPCPPSAEVAAIVARTTGEIPTGTETILLVEDEPALLDMVCSMLLDAGYTVLAAGTPEQALELARQHGTTIDLLLTDVVMPSMNGRDLHDQLTTELPSLPCIFMSGYTADVIADRGVLEDNVHFVQKPFTALAIGRKIREVLTEV